MFKRKLKILIPVCMFLIPICSTVHSAGIKDNPTVDPFKTWKIKFNQKINFDKITKSSISVVGKNNNLVPISLSLTKDRSSILVNPPPNGYKEGESYTLKVDKGVYSEKETHLNNIQNVEFNIIDYLTDAEIISLLQETENNTIKLCYSRDNEKHLYEGKNEYLPFTEEFNSEEKVLNFLKNYYTEDMSRRMMTYLGIKYVDGKYAEIIGDWGENTQWENTTITNMRYLDNNTLEFISDFTNKYSTNSDQNHYYTTYKLKFQNGKWLVDYNSNF